MTLTYNEWLYLASGRAYECIRRMKNQLSTGSQFTRGRHMSITTAIEIANKISEWQSEYTIDLLKLLKSSNSSIVILTHEQKTKMIHFLNTQGDIFESNKERFTKTFSNMDNVSLLSEIEHLIQIYPCLGPKPNDTAYKLLQCNGSINEYWFDEFKHAFQFNINDYSDIMIEIVICNGKMQEMLDNLTKNGIVLDFSLIIIESDLTSMPDIQDD